MEASGVCASDWHLVTGATRHVMPVIAGHEGAGIVEEVGPGVGRVAVGDRVCLSWAPDCGYCYQCTRGRPGFCETHLEAIWDGVLLDGKPRFSGPDGPIYTYSGVGCFATQTVVSEGACVKAPADVGADVAAITGCAVTTGFGAAVFTGGVQAGERVLVYGVGGVGLSAVMGANQAGAAEIVAVDRTQERAERARAFGATQALVDGPEVDEALAAVGPDVAIETTGIPAVQARCLKALRPGGRLVLVGLGASDALLQVSGADLVRQGKQILGSYYGGANPARDFARILDLYRAGRLPLDALISQHYALDRINEAYADLNAGKLLRGVIAF